MLFVQILITSDSGGCSALATIRPPTSTLGRKATLIPAPEQPRGARNRRNGGKTHETSWNHQHRSSATSPRKRSFHVRTTGPTTRG
jgi:hypothetical protein